MNVRDIHTQISLALPYPRNIIFAELVNILPKILPGTSLIKLNEKIHATSPGSSYLALVEFINNNLSASQSSDFRKRLRLFFDDALDLDTEPAEREVFTQEILRAFKMNM